MSENIIEILNTDVVIEIDEASYNLGVENLIVYDYNYSLNKPSINTVSLIGNKTSAELGLASTSEISAKESTENKVAAIDGDSTDIQYPSAKCVYDELSAKANKDLSDLSLTGQAIIDSKADKNLSNLTLDGKTVLDGQWVSSQGILASNAAAPKTSGIEHSLANYLPADGCNYEVLLSATVKTGTTSGNITMIRIYTDVISDYSMMCTAVTRTNNEGYASGSITLPVGASRKVYLDKYNSNTGTYNLAVNGYRRIGTNN